MDWESIDKRVAKLQRARETLARTHDIIRAEIEDLSADLKAIENKYEAMRAQYEIITSENQRLHLEKLRTRPGSNASRTR